MPHPFVFDTQDVGGQCTFENVFAYNVDKLIRSFNSGRLTIRGLRANTFTTGILIDRALDCPHISDVHFWQYYSEIMGNDPTHSVASWIQANGDGLWLKRVDNPFLTDVFASGMRAGVRISKSDATDEIAAGTSVTSAQFGSLMTDYCKYGIWVEQGATTGEIQIANLYSTGVQLGAAYIPGSTAIQIDGAAVIKVGQAKLYNTAGALVKVTNTAAGSVLKFGALTMINGQLADGTGSAPYIDLANSSAPHQIDFATRPDVDVARSRWLNWDTSNFLIPADHAWNSQYIDSFPNGGQISFYNNRPRVSFYPAGGAISSLTVYPPSIALPQQEIALSSMGTVSSVTWGGGLAGAGGPSSLSAGQTVRFQYIEALGAWRCTGK